MAHQLSSIVSFFYLGIHYISIIYNIDRYMVVSIYETKGFKMKVYVVTGVELGWDCVVGVFTDEEVARKDS